MASIGLLENNIHRKAETIRGFLRSLIHENVYRKSIPQRTDRVSLYDSRYLNFLSIHKSMQQNVDEDTIRCSRHIKLFVCYRVISPCTIQESEKDERAKCMGLIWCQFQCQTHIASFLRNHANLPDSLSLDAISKRYPIICPSDAVCQTWWKG